MAESTYIEYQPRRRPGEVVEAKPEPPGIIPATVVGTVLGALGALLFFLWEVGILARAGIALPSGSLLYGTVAVYAATGAVFGAIPGLTRRKGADWAVVAVLGFGGWLLAGKLALAFEDAGGAGWMAPMLMVPAGLSVGLILTTTEIPEGLKLGGATTAFVALALGLPINHFLLGDPTSMAALLVDLAVLLVALVCAGSAVALGGIVGRPGVLVPMITGTVIGFVLAWPAYFDRDHPWPLASEDAGPPVVLVVIDTLRADHLGAYGYGRDTSPVIDRLARSGLTYTDATASAPWTLPSVASMLTGQVPALHGAGVNTGWGGSRSAVRPSVPLLPTMLAEKGYVSAGITTNPFLTTTFGFGRGFDAYDDTVMPAAIPAAVFTQWAIGIDLLQWPMYREAAEITDQALSFVQAQEHRTWFLLVHYMDVHGPHRPDPEDVSAVGYSSAGALVDTYDASIHEVDRNLGRLLEALPDDAWIIVTSDHGEQLLEKRTHAAENAPPDARHGHTLYQEQLHVPLIVDGPGVGGRRVSRMVSTLDVTPTVLRLVKLRRPERAEGFPLVEVVGGRLPDDRSVYADSVRWGVEQQMVRQGRYKLVRWYTQGVLLYDLRNNPEESQAVSTQSDQKAQAMLRRLEGLLPPVGLAEVAGRAPVGAEMQLLLERLGYASPEPETP